MAPMRRLYAKVKHMLNTDEDDGTLKDHVTAFVAALDSDHLFHKTSLPRRPEETAR